MAIKPTLPFNFDEIYAYIEDKFVSAGYDIQEGSNTMQLVTAMSYLTSMLNANTAVNINETLLTLARKRNNVLQDARVLGYEIAHIQSYRYILTLRFTNDTAVDVIRSVDKYTKFTSGDYTYWYLRNPADDLVDEITVPAFGTTDVQIEVVEGDLRTFSDYPESLRTVIADVTNTDTGKTYTRNYVDVPFTDIEDTYGLEVFLTYYDADATFHEEEQWTRSNQFMIDSDTILARKFVRLDNIEYRTPRIYFKLGDVGQELRIGTIVQINALKSSGVNGAMVELPLIVDVPNVEVIDYAVSVQGTAEETLESIKLNAPLFHNSANRTVTRPDYIAFINRQPTVRYSEVWDGNREWPHIPGHIWFSFIPSTMIRDINDSANAGWTWTLQNTHDSSYVNYYVEDQEIQDVYTFLDDYRIPTLIYHHRHPIYVDFEYNIKIARYSIKTSKADVNLAAFNVINDYFRAEDPAAVLNPDNDAISVETFGFEYFQSNLIKRIDSELSDIMGFDVTLSTSINLNEKHINEEYVNDEDVAEIKFHLGESYEGLFNTDGTLITDNIPSIDTENVIGTKKLYTDKDSLVFDEANKIHYLDIKITDNTGIENPVTDEIYGQYAVFNKSYRDIEITLFVISNDDASLIREYTSEHTVGFDPLDLKVDEVQNGITLNVVYPSPNIKFTRNTIPRLKEVKFN